jgi:plastocyanin
VRPPADARILRPALLAAALAGAILSAASAATIEGRVALPRRRLAPVVNQRYEIVARAGVLSVSPPLAVVYVEGPFPARPAATAQMAQKDLEFVPSLLPIQAGTRVYFPNEDDTYHNIFSYSPTKRFDLGRYRSDERPIPSVVFDRAGLVALHCDIHEHMRALILVLDTPYFVVTAPNGTYRLPDVPAGPHTVKVWLNSRTTLARRLDLPAHGTVPANFP